MRSRSAPRLLSNQVPTAAPARWKWKISTPPLRIEKENVKFCIEPMATPVCRMAMIFDPDGNTICIHKRNVK